MISELRTRLHWWYAKRVGTKPQCGECENDASFFLWPEGYRCLMCYIRGKPYQGVGMMRDLQPSDYTRTGGDKDA